MARDGSKTKAPSLRSTRRLKAGRETNSKTIKKKRSKKIGEISKENLFLKLLRMPPVFLQKRLMVVNSKISDLILNLSM